MIKFEEFILREDIANLPEDRQRDLYARVLKEKEEEDFRIQQAILQQDAKSVAAAARLEFFQSLGLTVPNFGYAIGGAGGGVGSDPDFFFPQNMGFYVSADFASETVTLGSVDEGDVLFATPIALSNIDRMDVEGTGDERVATLRGKQGTYDVLFTANAIDGDPNHYSNFYKQGPLAYSSLDEIIELFIGRPEELIGSIRAGGPSNSGLLLTLDPSNDSVKRRAYFTQEVDPDDYTASTPGNQRIVKIDNKIYFVARTGTSDTADNAGAVIEYDISTDEAQVYSHTIEVGNTPEGLLQLANGRVLGTSLGGNFGLGAVYEFFPEDGTFELLYESDGGPDNGGTGEPIIYLGAYMFEASDGFLYLIATDANNEECVCQFDPDTNAMSIKANLNSFPNLSSKPTAMQFIELNGLLYGTTYTGGTNGLGQIFSYNLSTEAVTSLFSFATGTLTTSTGFNPQGGLFLASNGKMYGLTTTGSTSSRGTIYEFNPTGNVFTKRATMSSNVAKAWGAFIEGPNSELYAFGGTNTTNDGILRFNYTSGTISTVRTFSGADGSVPQSTPFYTGPTEESSGKIYGAATTGGEVVSGMTSNGTLFEYDFDSSQFQVLHTLHNPDLNDDSDPARPENKPIMASDGYMYGVTRFGGASAYGAIYKYDRLTNTITNMLSLSQTPTQGIYCYCYFVEKDGELWGASKYGGGIGSSLGCVFSWNFTTEVYTHRAGFDEATTGHGTTSGVMLASDGNFYGTNRVGGTSGGGTWFRYNPDTDTLSVIKHLGFPGPSTPDSTPIEVDGVLYFTSGNYPLSSFKLSDSTFTLLSPSNEAANPGDAFLASDGHLYGMTSNAGTAGLGYIWRYNISSNTFTTLFNFTSTTGAQPAGSFCESNGKLYGITYNGGANGFGSIFSWTIATSTFTKIIDLDGPINGRMLDPSGTPFPEQGLGFNHCTFTRIPPLANGFLNYGPSPLIEDWYDSLTVKPSLGLLYALNTLVEGMDADGNWEKLDFFALMAGMETDEQRLKPLVTTSGEDMVEVGTTYLGSDGFHGNGLDSYIDTRWNSVDNGTNFTTSNAIVGVYVAGQMTTVKSVMGNSRIYFSNLHPSATVTDVRVFATGTNSRGNLITSGGLHQLGINPSNTGFQWYGPYNQGDPTWMSPFFTFGYPAAALAEDFYIGAKNVSGVATEHSNFTVRSLYVGAFMNLDGPTSRLNTFYQMRGLTTWTPFV